MSFKSREKKRIIAASKFTNREVMAGRWYLTIVTRKTCCAKCGGILNVDAEMVYRHTPREALCTLCAEDKGLKPRLSTRWETSRRPARRSAVDVAVDPDLPHLTSPKKLGAPSSRTGTSGSSRSAGRT